MKMNLEDTKRFIRDIERALNVSGASAHARAVSTAGQGQIIIRSSGSTAVRLDIKLTVE